MSPLLLRSSLRWLARHPVQTGLSVLGVGLGVAMVVAVDLAAASAERAFELSTEAVAGRATHQLTGGPSGVPEELFPQLVTAGVHPAAPAVEGYLVVPAAPGGPRRVLRLLGVDPASERPFRPWLAPGGSGPRGTVDLAAFHTRPGAAIVGADTAASLGVGLGDRIAGLAAGRPATVEIVGLLEPADEPSRRALADLVVVDLATAQELLGMAGRLTRIDLILPFSPPSSGEPGRRTNQGTWPAPSPAEPLPASSLPSSFSQFPGLDLTPVGARAHSTASMTEAFRLNLRALSLLALVCGLFLIYNTMTFSVVQRRTLLGTLRALGVTRGQVLAGVAAEALAVAAVGTALGLAGGVVLGRGLVGLVSRTINDLYFVLAVGDLAVSPASLVRGAALGLAAGVLAALPPALEAASAPPRAAFARSLLEATAHRTAPRAALLGAALALAGGGLLALPGLPASFAGLFAVLVGGALATPAGTLWLMARLRRPAAALFGPLGRMAAGGAAASLSRTGVAVAALTVAVSVTVGVGTMIASFRDAVERWLDASLGADLYVTSPGAAGFADGGLDAALATRLAAVPGVADLDSVRRVEVPGADGASASPTRLVVLDVEDRERSGFDFRAGDATSAWEAFRRGEAALISEPYAARRGLGPGDTLTLRGDGGPRSWPIAGVVVSYASDAGLAYLARPAYDAAFADRALSGLSVRAVPGSDLDALAGALRAAAGDRPLVVQASAELKRASLVVFDRTFVITDVLRILAGLVAAIGVASALAALQLERVRELGVLRATGLTPGRLWRLVTAQTGLLGLAAGLFSMPLGLVTAAIMVYVINRRSFGWTVALEPSPAILAQAVALAVGAALVAGIVPAWKMARVPPAAALREE